MAAAAPAACLLLILLSVTTSSAHNITDILTSFPDYTEYNNLLTQTKLADEINNRQTITVLVLNNSVVTSALKSNPLDVIKTLLSIHVILDYFDATKLQNLPKGSTISTTLYQTSGVAPQRNGFVNITDSKGQVLFASATQGSKPTSVFTKSVKAEPYNISVIEISAPIDAPGVLNPPTTKGVNLTTAMINAGSKKFADLVTKLAVLQEYDDVKGTGLTVFAPSDDAWKNKGMPDWTKMSESDVRTVLRFHATPNYFPMATLKSMNEDFITLATIGADNYSIVPEASGDFVLLKTGVDSARVVNTIVDSAPVALFLIDNVLLPVQLFGNSSAPTPSGSPVPLPSPSSPTPLPEPGTTPPSAQLGSSPPASAPALTPPSEGPSQAPPAPSGEVPDIGPGPVPAADEDGKKKKNGGSRGSGEALSALLLAMVIGVGSVSLF
ncbi:hypothetical protein QQ045_023547 [Rhodiola kirilowii]